MISKDFRWCLFPTIVLALATGAAASPASEAAGKFLTGSAVEGTLLAIGGIFLVLSALTMGAAVAETVCFTCFTLLFAGRYLHGDDLWVPLGLLALGVAFTLMEVFVVPGFGVFGVMGIISLGTMSVLVMDSPQVGLAIFFLSTIASVLAGFFVIRYLPNTVVAKNFLILQPPTSEKGSSVPVTAFIPAVGETGIASSALRPQGVALFGRERLDVLTESEFVPRGQAVEVVRVEGSRVLVRACSPSSQLTS